MILVTAKGASAGFFGAISTNQTNLNLRTWALANGWDGVKPATITINSGVYVYSTTTGTPGLTINGTWAGGITLVNNGFVMGIGGNGGNGSPVTNPTVGGSAISLGVNCTITNTGYIGGGGGGGKYGVSVAGGGGAGGGKGGNVSGGTGGLGGTPGAAGGVGQPMCGGGGGRIMPGVGGAGGPANADYQPNGGSGGGAGGGGSGTIAYDAAQIGGAGGSAGAAGGNAAGGRFAAAGGGGWGASGGTSYAGAGAAGGKAIALNGFTATRNGAGTTYGVVS